MWSLTCTKSIFVLPHCSPGSAQTHAHQPPGPPAAAGRPADLPELPVQHQRGVDAPTPVHDCQEGRGERFTKHHDILFLAPFNQHALFQLVDTKNYILLGFFYWVVMGWNVFLCCVF